MQHLDFATFDLETSNLKADFSIVLCACIKPVGQPTTVFRSDETNPNWITDRANDKRIVKLVRDELAKHAVIVTHYGTGFDLKYLKAKLLEHRLQPLPQLFHVDTYSISKASMCVSSRRLANLMDYLMDGAEKSCVSGRVWKEAAYNGSKEDMDAIVAHCIVDVVKLEELATMLFPYIRTIKKV